MATKKGHCLSLTLTHFLSKTKVIKNTQTSTQAPRLTYTGKCTVHLTRMAVIGSHGSHIHVKCITLAPTSCFSPVLRIRSSKHSLSDTEAQLQRSKVIHHWIYCAVLLVYAPKTGKVMAWTCGFAREFQMLTIYMARRTKDIINATVPLHAKWAGQIPSTDQLFLVHSGYLGERFNTLWSRCHY